MRLLSFFYKNIMEKFGIASDMSVFAVICHYVLRWIQVTKI